jgi:hypothetical protein
MADEDWRITNQEKTLAGRTFRWAAWTPYRPGWDHDHCEFCWEEFGAADSDHVKFSAGWVTADDNRSWVCPACMTDFRDRFRFTTVD